MKSEELLKHSNFQDNHFGRSTVLSSDNAVLFVYSFLPGQAMTEHSHPFSHEFITVLEGESVISVGVESILAFPNTVVFVPREAIHSIQNHTQRPLLVSSFMTPKP